MHYKKIIVVSTKMKFHPILYILPFPTLNVIYGFIVGLYLISGSQLAIIISSTLYWTNLDNSKFRMLDIIIVQFSLAIHFIHCYVYQCIYPAMLMTLCMGVYKLGIMYNSNLIHSLIWIIGCISNYILISNFEQRMNTKLDMRISKNQ